MPPIKTPSIPLFLLALLIWALPLPGAFAANQVPEQNLPDLTGLSLEALLDMDITSVTKNATNSKDVPAAIYILTADDIRRSGATSIPEALRVVPGMHVARIDGNKWAVSTRGFSGQYANKLLVLMDGRSLYTPTYSGVRWDQEDVMLEDIERIEVIRGSGASLWGANAVNGVINIITKTAKKTQGALVSGHGGSQRKGGGLRYGVELGDQAYLKVYGRHSEYDQNQRIGPGGDAGDGSRLDKVGFRYDKSVNADKLNVQGDVFSGFSGGARQNFPTLSAPLAPVLSPPYSRLLATDLETSGHYLMGRWEHQTDTDSSTVLRAYWNSNERQASEVHSVFQIDTVDMDFQHNARVNARHALVWGAGARLNVNRIQSSLDLGWAQGHRLDDIYSVFAQDEMTLLPERWKLTVGSKFEHNPVTQFEWQPTARLLWTPAKPHSIWASVSRSVRTPSWVEQDLNYNIMIRPPVGGGAAQPNNPLTLVAAVGNKNFTSETMLAYEMGWRGELSPRLSVDAAFYYDDYHHILTETASDVDTSHMTSGYLLQTVAFTNKGHADIIGGEASLAWRVSKHWKLRASYAHTAQRFALSSQDRAGTANPFDHSSPTHQALLWSMLQIAPQIHLDMNWRYVDGVKVRPQPVAAYHELDARLAWEFGHGLELALVGRNLLNTRHVEYGSYFFSVPTAVQREVYATVLWEF